MTSRFPFAPLAATILLAALMTGPARAQGVPRALVQLSLTTIDSLRNLNPPLHIWVQDFEPCPPGYELAAAHSIAFGSFTPVTNSKGYVLCVLKPPTPEASLPAPPPPGPETCDAEYTEVFFQPDGSPLTNNIRACQRISDSAGTVYVEGTFDSAARTFNVFCPAGYLATGWGHSGKVQTFSGFAATDSLLVTSSQPLPLEGWSVRLKSTSGVLTIARVWAVCIRVGD
jgi:hypothetical protein